MPTSLFIQVASVGGVAEICRGPGSNNSSSPWSTTLCHCYSSSPSSSPNSSSVSSSSSATTVITDGSGGASTAVLVYLHLVPTGVTMMDNSGTSVVTTLAMALVLATAVVVNGDNGDSAVDNGGDDDGYAPVAGGSGPSPNWVVEEQQYGGSYAEDDSGPLARTFGTSQDFSAEDSIIFPTLGPGFHVPAHPSRHRCALLALSKRRIDGAQWWVGDSCASVHGTGSMDHFYNTCSPTPEKSRLIVGTGEVV